MDEPITILDYDCYHGFVLRVQVENRAGGEIVTISANAGSVTTVIELARDDVDVLTAALIALRDNRG